MPDRSETDHRGTWLDWLEQRFNVTETLSFLTSFGLFPVELDTRLRVRAALDEAFKKPAPSYLRWPRVLGILSVQLFLLLGLTGVMLAFYYQPTEDAAHASVTVIVRDVSFGWFVHQTHVWAGRLLVAVLLLRLARFFFQGLYKPPREGLWMAAALSCLVALAESFTGGLLSWDSSGYWSTVRGVEAIQAMPILGSILTFVVGESVDSLMLTRFYVLHMMVLPVALLFLFHLALTSVRRVGLSAVSAEESNGPGDHKVYFYNVLILSVLVLGVIITVATLLPVPFGATADPFSTPPAVASPWFLLAAHTLVDAAPAVIPRWIRGGLCELAMLALLLLPFIDRGPWRPARDRRLAVILGIAVIVLFAAVTLYGYSLEVWR